MSTWTFADDGNSVADEYDAEAVVEDGTLHVYFDGTSRPFPLDVVADLLRAAGYTIVPPNRAHGD